MERLTRYFVDQNGRYIGGFEGVFDNDNPPPPGYQEVPRAPEHAADTWDFVTQKYLTATRPVATPSLEEMVEALVRNQEGDPTKLNEVKVRRAAIRGA